MWITKKQLSTDPQIMLLHIYDENDLLVSEKQMLCGSSGSEPDVYYQEPPKVKTTNSKSMLAHLLLKASTYQ